MNMTSHYAIRNPQSILFLRDDTLSQLLVLANIRPGGRYLVVDDTGGLVTAAVMERMGCEGRILTFTEADSPPAWGVLQVMNWGARELECVKWLNWLEMDEEYERPPPPPEDDLPSIKPSKLIARIRRHNTQVHELNATRDELHSGTWDALVLATDLSPLSVLARLTPYLAGSASIAIYSPYQQVLAEVLQYTRKDPKYLNANLTESWQRTYQVLPGRTHPLMTTSGTGGYLFHATRVFPSKFEPEARQRQARRQKAGAGRAKANHAGASTVSTGAQGGDAEAEAEAEAEPEGESSGVDDLLADADS